MSLRNKTLSGVAWSGVSQAGRNALDIAAMVVLARLLSPRDFGLMAMIYVFSMFAQLFADFGFGAALIQTGRLEESQRSSVFWLNVAAGLALTLSFAAASPWIARFYGEPSLTRLNLAVSLNFLIGSFAIVHNSLAQRELKFKRLAWIEMGSVALGAAATLPLAWRGFGVWSLALRMLLTTTLRAAALWFTSDWRPRFIWDRAAVGRLLGFSANLMGFQSFNYWARNADNLIVSRVLGAAALGVYAWAYRIMIFPIAQVTTTLQQVMFPALSRIQDDREKLKSVHLQALRLIAFITMPMVGGIFAIAPTFVRVALGEQWMEVAPVLRVLCVVAFKQPLGAASGWLYQSRGRTDLMFRWGIAAGLSDVTSFLIGSRWGVLGVAGGYCVSQYLLWWPAVTIPGRLVGMTFGEYARNVAGVCGCALAMTAATWFLESWTAGFMGPGTRLALLVLAGAAIYAGLAMLFRLRAAREVIDLLGEMRGGPPKSARS